MNTRRTIAGLATALALVGLIVLVPGGHAAERAPSVVARNLRDSRDRIDLAAQRSRPQVIVFFSSWCNLCQSELETIEAIHQRVGNQVEFIGVNFSDQRSRALELLDKARVTFVVVDDRSGEIAEKFGVSGVPSSVLVDAGRRIIERHHGYDWDIADRLRSQFSV